MRRRVVLLTDEIANVLDSAGLREKIIFEALEERKKQRDDEKRSGRRLRKHQFLGIPLLLESLEPSRVGRARAYQAECAGYVSE